MEACIIYEKPKFKFVIGFIPRSLYFLSRGNDNMKLNCYSWDCEYLVKEASGA